MVDNTGFSLEWDSPIEQDSPDYIILPEGDYDFTVTNFERARHPGSAKLPPCNKAILTITIETNSGIANIRDQLFLHSKTEGMLCAFFAGIGQRKKGERLVPRWNEVIGATGRCQVGQRTYTKDNGESATANEIKKYYEKEPGMGPSIPTQMRMGTGYTPGKF